MTVQEQNIDGEYGVYVGTYSKYNNGNLNGAWLFLENYDSKEEFEKACLELHKDEEDCEIMIQDIYGDAKPFCDGDIVKEIFWVYILLEEYEKQLVNAYIECNGGEFDENTLEEAQNHFIGRGESLASVMEEFTEECGLLENVPDSIRYCIDWDLYGKHEFYTQYIGYQDCFVFQH